MKGFKIVLALALGSIGVMAYLYFNEYKRAEYWRTQPARNARHKKPEPEQEQEQEQEFNEVEKLTELQNEK